MGVPGYNCSDSVVAPTVQVSRLCGMQTVGYKELESISVSHQFPPAGNHWSVRHIPYSIWYPWLTGEANISPWMVLIELPACLEQHPLLLRYFNRARFFWGIFPHEEHTRDNTKFIRSSVQLWLIYGIRVKECQYVDVDFTWHCEGIKPVYQYSKDTHSKLTQKYLLFHIEGLT